VLITRPSQTSPPLSGAAVAENEEIATVEQAGEEKPSSFGLHRGYGIRGSRIPWMAGSARVLRRWVFKALARRQVRSSPSLSAAWMAVTLDEVVDHAADTSTRRRICPLC